MRRIGRVHGLLLGNRICGRADDRDGSRDEEVTSLDVLMIMQAAAGAISLW